MLTADSRGIRRRFLVCTAIFFALYEAITCEKSLSFNINGSAVANLTADGTFRATKFAGSSELLNLTSNVEFQQMKALLDQLLQRRMVSHCPEDMVRNGPYCIDKSRYVAPNSTEAMLYCYRSGKALCSWSQWTSACENATALGLNQASMLSAAGIGEIVDSPPIYFYNSGFAGFYPIAGGGSSCFGSYNWEYLCQGTCSSNTVTGTFSQPAHHGSPVQSLVIFLKMQAQNNTITLNVGGQIFVTTETTIRNLGDGNLLLSLINRARSNQIQTTRDDQGNIFLDRDPVIFAQMLNWGRNKVWDDSSNVSPYAIQAELDFFGVKDIEFVKKIDVEQIKPLPVPNLPVASNDESQRLLLLSHNSFEHRITRWISQDGASIKRSIDKAASKGKLSLTRKIDATRILRNEYARDKYFSQSSNMLLFKSIMESKMTAFFGLRIVVNFSFPKNKTTVWLAHLDIFWGPNDQQSKYCHVIFHQ